MIEGEGVDVFRRVFSATELVHWMLWRIGSVDFAVISSYKGTVIYLLILVYFLED